MINAIDHIIDNALLKENDSRNIYYYPYGSLFEYTLKDAGFYMFSSKNMPSYSDNVRPESNMTVMKGNSYPSGKHSINAIIVNIKKLQYDSAEKIAYQYHLPLIIVDHELPLKKDNENMIKWINSQCKNSAIVYPNEIVRESWLYEDENCLHIPYGFDEVTYPKKDDDIVIVGDYAKNDKILIDMINCHSKTKGIGYNNGMSPYASINDLIEKLKRFRICICASPLNMPPLFAMLASSLGCSVITNRTKWTSSVFKNGETATLFKDSSEIKKIVGDLMNDDVRVESMGLEAKKMMARDYNSKDSNKKWQSLINDLVSKAYIR